MEKLTMKTGEEVDNSKIEERKIAIDPETSEIFKEFPVNSDFGINCWQGPHFFNLVIPKNIFKKIGPGDPRIEALSKTFGAKEDADVYSVKLPLSASEGKVLESPEETEARIQKIIDVIERAYKDSLAGNLKEIK